MRMICVDYGDARIGLAVCDETETLASPLATIKSLSMRKNIDNVARIAHEEGAGRIVVGLPRKQNQGFRQRACQSFGNRRRLFRRAAFFCRSGIYNGYEHGREK